MNAGIYFIKCLVNNKMYIGSARNLETRWNEHFKLLIKNKHWNNLLQDDFNKYGKDNFIYGILKNYLLEENLVTNENLYMHKYKTLITKYGYKFGYNKYPATRNNTIQTQETKDKISNSLKGENHFLYGKKLPEEWIEKISNGRKGMKFSNKHKENISNSLKGKKQSDKHINNMIESKLKLSLNDCIEIKQLLLEKTNEKWMDKYERIAKKYNCLPRTIMTIKAGKYYYSKYIGGNYKDWLKEIK